MPVINHLEITAVPRQWQETYTRFGVSRISNSRASNTFRTISNAAYRSQPSENQRVHLKWKKSLPLCRCHGWEMVCPRLLQVKVRLRNFHANIQGEIASGRVALSPPFPFCGFSPFLRGVRPRLDISFPLLMNSIGMNRRTDNNYHSTDFLPFPPVSPTSVPRSIYVRLSVPGP